LKQNRNRHKAFADKPGEQTHFEDPFTPQMIILKWVLNKRYEVYLN